MHFFLNEKSGFVPFLTVFVPDFSENNNNTEIVSIVIMAFK
jgi:hypothetical protein